MSDREAKRARAYAEKALANAAERAAAAPDGDRNNTLSRATYGVARMAASGHLRTEDVAETMTDAGARAGLPRREARATVLGRIKAATKDPWDPTRELTDRPGRRRRRDADAPTRTPSAAFEPVRRPTKPAPKPKPAREPIPDLQPVEAIDPRRQDHPVRLWARKKVGAPWAADWRGLYWRPARYGAGAVLYAPCRTPEQWDAFDPLGPWRSRDDPITHAQRLTINHAGADAEKRNTPGEYAGQRFFLIGRAGRTLHVVEGVADALTLAALQALGSPHVEPGPVQCLMGSRLDWALGWAADRWDHLTLWPDADAAGARQADAHARAAKTPDRFGAAVEIRKIKPQHAKDPEDPDKPADVNSALRRMVAHLDAERRAGRATTRRSDPPTRPQPPEPPARACQDPQASPPDPTPRTFDEVFPRMSRLPRWEGWTLPADREDAA